MIQPLKYEFAPLNGGLAGDGGAGRATNLTDQELDAIRAAAFDDGRARGLAEAEATDGHRSADALEAVRAALGRLAGGFDKAHADLEDGAATLAMAIGRAVAGVASARDPLDAIAPLIAEALDGLTGEMRIDIEVHEAILGLVETEVAGIVEDTGFAGRVRVRAGADNIADCRIDWGEGGIERRISDITSQIADRLAAHGIALPPARTSAQAKAQEA